MYLSTWLVYVHACQGKQAADLVSALSAPCTCLPVHAIEDWGKHGCAWLASKYLCISNSTRVLLALSSCLCCCIGGWGQKGDLTCHCYMHPLCLHSQQGSLVEAASQPCSWHGRASSCMHVYHGVLALQSCVLLCLFLYMRTVFSRALTMKGVRCIPPLSLCLCLVCCVISSIICVPRCPST